MPNYKQIIIWMYSKINLDVGCVWYFLHSMVVWSDLQGIRLESFSKCDFIPVDYTEVRSVKSSFKKLMRACVPSAPFLEPEKGFLRAIEESGWLNQIENILQIAGVTIDLLDVQGSSVMICLEDGWDFTTQVSLRPNLYLLFHSWPTDVSNRP